MINSNNNPDMVYISSADKHSVEVKMGVWSGCEMTGGEYIPADAPDSYKLYRRLYISYLNRRATFESLYWNAGSIEHGRYMEAMKEMERNIDRLREFYQYKSVSLLIVNAQNTADPVQVKLFDDIYLCNYFTKHALGVTVEEINAQQMPQHLRGTRIFEQDWHTSQEQIDKRYPRLDNTDFTPPTQHRL